MARRRNGLGAQGLVFANNLIVGGGTAVSIYGPLDGAAWEGNVVWNNDGGAGDIPEAGFVSRDPHMRKDDGNVFRPSPESPVIGAGVGNHEYVGVDLDGERRGAKPDVGADQVSNRAGRNRVLAVEDVGPGAPESERPLLDTPEREPWLQSSRSSR